VHVRNRLQLSQRPAEAISALFHLRCNQRKARTTFPPFFRSPLSHRQRSARRHQIVEGPHVISPTTIKLRGSRTSPPLTDMRLVLRGSTGPPLRLCLPPQIPSLCTIFRRAPTVPQTPVPRPVRKAHWRAFQQSHNLH